VCDQETSYARSPARGLQNTNPLWVVAPVEEEEEYLIRLLESLTNIVNSRNYRRIPVGYTRNDNKMRKHFRKFEKGIASLLGELQAKYL
jgi:hypothetical protein